jgi:hypothetical protein
LKDGSVLNRQALGVCTDYRRRLLLPNLSAGRWQMEQIEQIG